eukprot:TRINITY_DN12397_c0_g1_i4.p1 TRINITY_DN12397_c0_g1~~TRINITY_DN12397_c0_g1_i4.p1  ORF type:complete len:389 (-),score=129.26 TRINITY_DN12397_c0_g1_i4:246-1412(-)
MADDDDDEVFFTPDLFLQQDYVLQSFTFGGVFQDLYCSQAASTDFDLTGQIVWPISEYMAWLVRLSPAAFAGKRVVELGAGCGLSGLVASQYAAATALTDGSDVVLDLLRRSVALQRERAGSAARSEGRCVCATACGDLSTGCCCTGASASAAAGVLGAADDGGGGGGGSAGAGSSACLQCVCKAESHGGAGGGTSDGDGSGSCAACGNGGGACACATDDANSGSVGSPQEGRGSERCGELHVASLLWGDRRALDEFLEAFGPPDVLLGADVVCWPAFITPFLLTVKGLLQASRDARAAALYLGYVCRATSTTDALMARAAALGLDIAPMPMPDNPYDAEGRGPASIIAELKLQAFQVTLGSSPAALEPPPWPEPGDQDPLLTTATPC